MSLAARLRDGLRTLLEPTPLAPIYRSVRDEYAFRQAKFVRTPLGFMFAGHAAMCAGAFEVQEVAELKALLQTADVFVDVGANIGYFSCLAASLGKHVVAVEPLAANLRLLLANISANQWERQVEVFPVGVADRFGVARFYGGGTGASLNEGWAGASRFFSTMIALSTLDTLCAKFKHSRMVIKVDVEGAEYQSLLGATEVLNYQPAPAWLVEITLREHRGGAVNADYLRTFDLFFAAGYQCRSVGNPRLIDRGEIESYATMDGASQPEWARSGNFIFFRAE